MGEDIEKVQMILKIRAGILGYLYPSSSQKERLQLRVALRYYM